MAKVLVGTVEVERIGELRQDLHPREIFINFVCFVTVAGTLWWLVVDENSWRFFAANFTAKTRLGRVTSVRQRADFSL